MPKDIMNISGILNNKPDVNFLGQFRKPNAFPVFGMQLYKKVKNESLQSLAGTH